MRSSVSGSQSNVLEWAVESVRNKGVVQTTKVAGSFLLDLSFDWRYGTDTRAWVDRSDLITSSANKAHSAPYGPTKVRPFIRLLRRLDLPRDCTFVDIGSGKGRALLVAATYGFRKVVGIEFSHDLCRTALQNVQIYSSKVPRASPIEVLELDAASYRFGPDDRVLFMYNPFDAHVMTRLLGNLAQSLDEHPRSLWVIYNAPEHHDLVSSSGLFTSGTFVEIGGNHFRVYTAPSEATR